MLRSSAQQSKRRGNNRIDKLFHRKLSFRRRRNPNHLLNERRCSVPQHDKRNAEETIEYTNPKHLNLSFRRRRNPNQLLNKRRCFVPKRDKIRAKKIVKRNSKEVSKLLHILVPTNSKKHDQNNQRRHQPRGF